MKTKIFFTFFTLIAFACASVAQIKTKKEYDYIGNEVNKAGLRVVGIKNSMQGYYGEPLYDYGCINKDGIEVVPVAYNKIQINPNWNFIVVEYQKKGGILSEDGKYTLIYPKYNWLQIVPSFFMDKGCCIFKSFKGHYGIVNSTGEEIVQPVYDEITWISKENGYMLVKLNSQYGIIRYDGKIIVTPQYDYLEYCKGMIILGKDGQYKVCDIHKKELIPYGKYDEIGCCNGYTFWAYENKSQTSYLINRDGSIVYSFINKMLTNKKENNTYRKAYEKISTRRENIIQIEEDVTKNHVSHLFPMKNSQSIASNKLYNYQCKIDSGLQIIKDNKKQKIIYIDDDGKRHSDRNSAMMSNKVIHSKYTIDEELDEKEPLAKITWMSDQGSVMQQHYELNVDVKSKSKITDITITINGIQDRGIKTVNSSDYNMTINRTLTLNEGTNIIKLSATNAAGTVQEEKTIIYRPQGVELASIEWIDFAATTNKKDFSLKLGIKSKCKIEEVNVTLNGELSRGIKTVATNGNDLTVDRVLSLNEGSNRVIVSVRNCDGISTSEKTITYQKNDTTPVFNDKRIALVIGNSHYSNAEMNLTNPENDATDVAEKLKGLGFDVILRVDATLEDMDKELTSFDQKAKEYDVALFYYAGHGIQNKGLNYIIPINIENLAEDNIKSKCVDMERVLDVMEDANCKLKIVILDACRNDPLSRKWHRSLSTRGLSIMNAPEGTIISYSTSPGKTALDGTGRNSPYTEAFLHTLEVPNLDVFHFFQKVGASVLDKTKKSQNPWLSVSFTGDFYFNKQQTP